MIRHSLFDIGRKRRPQAAILVASVLAMLLWMACGDTYRPVANPQGLPAAAPVQREFALVASQNGSSAGAVSQIDVSGDVIVAATVNSLLGNVPVQTNPVYVVSSDIPTTLAMVANRDSNSVSIYSPTTDLPYNAILVGSSPVFLLPVTSSTGTSGAISAVVIDPLSPGTGFVVGDQLTVTETNASGGVIQVTGVDASASNSITGVSLVTGGTGYYIATAAATTGGHGSGALVNITAVNETSTLFVANAGDKTVTVLNPTITPPEALCSPTGPQPCPSVGTTPMALAADAPGTQVYVLNRDSSNISVISNNASSNYPVSPTPLSGNGITNPVAAITNPSSNIVYVLNGGGNIVAINAASNTFLGTITTPALTTPSPCLTTPPDLLGGSMQTTCAPMTFDPFLQRIYVADGATLHVIDVATTATPAATLISDPSLTSPAMVAVLPSTAGDTVYVLNGVTQAQCDALATTPATVSVINPNTNTVIKTVAVGACPVSIAASPDGSKVYVVHQRNGLDTSGNATLPPGTSIISTATNTFVTDIAAPLIQSTCPGTCLRMTPEFVTTGQ